MNKWDIKLREKGMTDTPPLKNVQEIKEVRNMTVDVKVVDKFRLLRREIKKG